MADHDSLGGSAWSPLRREVFRALWMAAIVSNVGTWMQNVGGVWLMTSLTQSPVMVALMQTATSLPVFLVVLPAGALADIVDRRRILLFTQTWMCLAAAGLSALTLEGATTPWALLGFTFALGLGSAMNMPVWQAVIPELVPRTELLGAVALNSVAFNIARAIGPALGGIIVAIAGPAAVFLLNAVSFVGVIAVVYRWDRSAREKSLPAEHVIPAIRAGTRYALHAPELRAVLVRCLAFILCSSALWALMPVVARHDLGLGSRGFGALFGCVGVGALLGAAILPKMRRSASPDGLVQGGTVGLALVILGLAFVRNVGVLYAVMVVGGVTWMATMANLTVAAQTSAPSWVRARALGFYTLAFQGGMAVASVVWGAVAEYSGSSFALTCAAIGLAVGLAARAKWPLQSGADLDLRPSLHWPEPIVTTEPDPEQGPVLVTVEYHVDAASANEFVNALHALGRIRQRDGARRWGLFRDLAEPSRYIETFIIESWAEHLRQHTRVTVADRAVEDRVRALCMEDNPTVVSHFIYERGKGI
jgi:MFS family permease